MNYQPLIVLCLICLIGLSIMAICIVKKPMYEKQKSDIQQEQILKELKTTKHKTNRQTKKKHKRK